MRPSDADLCRILRATKVIAAVGVSKNPTRPSHFVGRYLTGKGFRVIPVNPVIAGETLFGETVYGEIGDIPDTIPVDMLEIFRRPEFVPDLVREGIAHLPHLKTIWMQIGVEHAEAAAEARAHGLEVVEDLCPKMENQRLFGELRMAGMNTGIISSKL